MIKPFLYTLCVLFSFSVLAAEDIAGLQKQLEDIRESNQVSAAVVLLVDKNAVILEAHLGKPDWDSDQSLNSGHMFRIGSVSKTFAGLLALRMQEKGEIDLSKPFDHYVKKPFLKNTFFAETGVDITLAQLLEHTAGLQDLKKPEWDYNDDVALNLEQSFALKLGNHSTQWPPGRHSSYSNVGSGLLGLALEKASGKSYEDLMDEYVFEPLAMQSSTLLLTNAVQERLITGYDTDGKSKIPYWHNIYRPFAAINTDASDMVQFLQLFLNTGVKGDQTFLSSTSLARMEVPQTTLAARSGLKYAYGLGIFHWQKEGHSFHGHGGDADGYLTHFAYNKETGLAYIVMVNAFDHAPLRQMRSVLETYITKDLPKPHYPRREKLSTDILQQYVGDYVEVTKRFGPLQASRKKLKVLLKDGQLYTQKEGQRAMVLFNVKKNNKKAKLQEALHFRRSYQSVATLALVRYEGDIYLQGDIGNFIKIHE